MPTTHFTDWPPAFALRVVEARLTVNVAKVGKMSPYVEVTVASQTFRTRVISCPDLQPRWNETSVFAFGKEVLIVVYHKSMMLKDSEVGRCMVDPENCQFTEWVTLTNCGREVGAILVSLQWISGGPQAKAAEMQDEYLRRLNELELQKEEVEFYKLKYRKKLEGLKKCLRTLRKTRDDSPGGVNSSRHYVQTEPCEIERTHSRNSLEDDFNMDSGNRLQIVQEMKKIESNKQAIKAEHAKLRALRRKLEIQKMMMETAHNSLCDACRNKQSGSSIFKSMSENRVKSPLAPRRALVDSNKSDVKLHMLKL